MHLNDKAVLNICKELYEPSVSWFEVRAINMSIWQRYLGLQRYWL